MILNFLFSLAAEMILWARARPRYEPELKFSQRQLTYQILHWSTGLGCGDTGLSVEIQVAAIACSHYLISSFSAV